MTGGVKARVLSIKALQAARCRGVGGSAFRALWGATRNASSDGLVQLASGENPATKPRPSQRELVGLGAELTPETIVEVRCN
jgi:hypothetical protein